jgi:hypothetical protein
MPFLTTPTNNSHQLWDDFIKRAYDEQFEIFQVYLRSVCAVHIRAVASLLQPAQMCTRTRTRTRERAASRGIYVLSRPSPPIFLRCLSACPRPNLSGSGTEDDATPARKAGLQGAA